MLENKLWEWDGDVLEELVSWSKFVSLKPACGSLLHMEITAVAEGPNLHLRLYATFPGPNHHA